MTNSKQSGDTRFGGAWTIEKLNILEHYLNGYTTALKNQPFKLMYIDAFAGTGQIALAGRRDEVDFHRFVSGSAERAVKIDDKPFDKLIFVEKDSEHCAELKALHAMYPERDLSIENSEANAFLSNLREDWYNWRGVLFLDPFAATVEWSTIEKVAGVEALDTWILFPTSAITRMLPTSNIPEEISQGWATRLTRVFGDGSWRDLYREKPQGNLFGKIERERDRGVNGLVTLYKRRLKDLFGARFLDKSCTLKNSKNSPLFEFLFCVGSRSPKAIAAAKGIAQHILKDL